MTSAALRQDEREAPVLATARAALYLRVSTGRLAESDLSIPDPRRQIEGYCLLRGWEIAAEFVEPGNTATDDRRGWTEFLDLPLPRQAHGEAKPRDARDLRPQQRQRA